MMSSTNLASLLSSAVPYLRIASLLSVFRGRPRFPVVLFWSGASTGIGGEELSSLPFKFSFTIFRFLSGARSEVALSETAGGFSGAVSTEVGSGNNGGGRAAVVLIAGSMEASAEATGVDISLPNHPASPV
jgi:hypothetical protein